MNNEVNEATLIIHIIDFFTDGAHEAGIGKGGENAGKMKCTE